LIKNQKAGLFTGIYILLFFSIAIISMKIFAILVLSLGSILVIDLFAKVLSKWFKFRRVVSLTLSMIFIFSIFVVAFVFLIPAVIKEIDTFVVFIDRFFVNREWEKFFTNIFPDTEKTLSNFIVSLQPKLLEFLNSLVGKLPAYGQQIALFLAYYFLLTLYGIYNIDSLKKYIGYLYPRSIRSTGEKFFSELYHSLDSFVFSTFFSSIFVGVCAFFIMSFLGIKYTVLMSFWAFVTNFIPIVGVIFEFVPLALVGLSSGVESMIWLLVLMSAIHASAFIFFLFVMRGYSKINPFFIILAILIFGQVFNVLGILIAVPLCLIIKLFWSNFIKPYFERG